MPSLTFPIRGRALSMTMAVSGHVVHVDSDFQAIDVYDTEAFGRVLLLDGHIQLAELDEHAYHECLVRVPLLNHANPKRALVVGGGDGGALRELCRFSTLHSIDMVEIDRAVIDVCRRHLPSVGGGAFDDPRVTVHIEDAFNFVKGRRGAYDVVLLDSTDTYEGETGELSEALFTKAFYGDCFSALNSGGYVVTQADNPVFCPNSLSEIQAKLHSVFPLAGNYLGLVPSFGGYSAYSYGSHGNGMRRLWDSTWEPTSYLSEETYNFAFSGLTFKRP
ncbi:MAG: spermine/spermidine synthase domain-containing protein [Fimbriimonadaceae bacterium]